MTDAASSEFDDLSAHLGWVRALARRLVQDAHAADDLTQETLRVALEARQAAGVRPRSARAWLAAVLRNQGRAHHRKERARAAREERYSGTRSEAQPSALETLERAASQRQLIDTVLALDEPYRTVILLRFFEELSAQEVAERMDCRPSTVATRTAEALRRIRQRLGRGGRGEWLPALLPLLSEEPSAAAPLSSGPLLLSGAPGLAAVGILLAGLTGVWWRGASPEAVDPVQPVGAVSDVLEAPGSRAGSPGLVAQDGERRDAAGARDATPRTDPVGPTGSLLVATRRGKVVDESGRPVPNIELVYTHRAPLAVGGPVHAGLTQARTDRCFADDEGVFELRGQPPMTVTVQDSRFVAVREGLWMEGDRREPRVVVARRSPLAGRVVDEKGEPVAEADLQLLLPAADTEHEASSARRWWSRSDASGAFEFDPVPAMEGLHLRVGAMGFAAGLVPVPCGGDPGLTVVLSKEAFDGFHVEGRVHLASGEPAAGAWVSAGTRSVRCDEEGRYRLSGQLPAPVREVRLQAALPGCVPGTRTIALPVAGGQALVVDLELGGSLPRLAGRVVDLEGRPVPGVEVELLEGTPFGLLQDPEQGWYQRKTLEDLSGTSHTQSDRQGRFELTCLPGRSYVIQASRWRDACGVVSEPVEGGDTDLVLVLDVAQVELVGRIVDLAGAPVAGVRVRPTRRRGDGGFSVAECSAISDADGTFVLAGAPRTLRALRLEGEGIVPEVYRELDELPWPGGPVELVAARRCVLRLDWGLERRASTRLSVTDEGDEVLSMLEVTGSRISVLESCSPPPAGESILCLPRTATWAVLRDGEQEIARYPLRLDPDRPTLLRL